MPILKKRRHPDGGNILILGIDPGLAATGWGVIDVAGANARFVDAGVIRTSAACEHIVRLDQIRHHISTIATKWDPQFAGVERVFVGVNAKSSIALGEARGAAIAALLQCQIRVMEISALQIKKSITGSGRADKKQVAAMLPAFLTDAPESPPADAADALACALAASSPLSQLTRHSRLPPIRSRPRSRRVSRR